MHILNTPETVVQSFSDILKTVEGVDYIITFDSVLARSCKISESKNAVICQKLLFPRQKGRCASSICLKHLCKVFNHMLKNCR